MARSIWTGYVSFGLVSIPVGLFAATEEHEVDFHQFQRGTSDRIRYKRVNERTGHEVDYDDIVKGHDIGGGDHVIVEPDELAEIAPGRSRSLEITAFVDLAEIDPVHFQRSYYLAPSDEENTASYALLREALTKSGRAGVATFVMRNKEYLAAIRAAGDVLVLETMYFADEIRDPAKELDTLPDKESRTKQIGLAAELIEAMSQPWTPTEYRDTYTERIEELVEAKKNGAEVVTESEPESTGPTDLLAALERSVADAKGGRKGATATNRRRGKGGAKGASGGGSAPDDLSGATKKELQKLARELDVAGRSSMTRDELAKAVIEAKKAMEAA